MSGRYASMYQYKQLRLTVPDAPLFFFSTVVDLNGDGNDDIIALGATYPTGGTPDQSAQPGYLFLGDGTGGFSLAPDSVFPSNLLQSVHPRKVIVTDLNADGRNDIFISDHGWDASPFPGAQNRLYLSTPSGSWVDASAGLPQISDYSHSSAAGDINLDGKIDIFVGNGYWGGAAIAPYMLENKGNGVFNFSDTVFSSSKTSSLDPQNGYVFPGSTLTDLDRDGSVDLIITSDESLSFFKNRAPFVYWNTGGQYDESKKTILNESAVFSSAIVLDVDPIDINRDGYNDLIAIGTQGDPFYDGWFVQAFLNNGDRTFKEITASAFGAMGSGGAPGQATGTAWPIWARPVDFNLDGWADFIVEYNGVLTPSMPMVWINNGSNSFSALTVGDFFSDNDQDKYSHQIFQYGSKYSFISQIYGEDQYYINVYNTNQEFKFQQVSYSTMGSGPDIITNTVAHDNFDASGGLDEFFSLFARNSAKITISGSEVTIENDNFGIDTIANVERFLFSDGELAFDLSGNAGQVYRLYQAAFARVPDQPGLKHNVTLVDGGLSLQQMSSAFLASAEFQQKYGSNPTDGEYINALYRNVLDRDADPAGLEGWQGRLLDGSWTRTTLLIGFSESPENIAKVAPVISNGIWLA
ncbi:FG-GAP-like repeat-containing protein [Rhabdaerophilum sp. SD176]|uniref:FG-GAP-like repeat-containing protein n=1 Tax=Rhabdaerophilum sp. SD176 TaxID=2983548 RepID=UPI0024DF3634|nr:FG-GAP-like repeat-containing protein [Rhabdaerophilum sp. SD176]